MGNAVAITFKGRIFVTEEAWEVFANVGVSVEGGDYAGIHAELAGLVATYNADKSSTNIYALLKIMFTQNGLALATGFQFIHVHKQALCHVSYVHA